MADDKKEPWLNLLALTTVILAVIYLQIGILLSSIAALLKQKPVYRAGLAVGLVGVVYFVNGFFLFFPV